MFPPAADSRISSPAIPPPLPTQQPGGAPALGTRPTLMSDDQWVELFKRCKKESYSDRWRFESQWTKIIHYLNNRQWLAPYSRTYGWRDARIAKGVPKPVTNKAGEIDQALRSMFTAE